LKAGKQDEAEKLYRELLELNPENYNYYAGLRKAMGLAPAAGTHSSRIPLPPRRVGYIHTPTYMFLFILMLYLYVYLRQARIRSAASR
jgi:hypothetical protein